MKKRGHINVFRLVDKLGRETDNAIFKLPLIVFFLLISATGGFTQVVITQNSTASSLASMLSGTGVTISNYTKTCDNNGTGTFTNSGTNLGIANGIVLASGRVTSIPQAANTFASTQFTGSGDADLSTLTTGTIYDKCVLEFDIIPQGSTLQFKYVFASEEYPEFVCSQYNDVFGFFITGPNPAGGNFTSKNIATIPNTTTPVCINAVNPGTSGTYNGTTWNSANCISLGYSSLYVNNLSPTINPNIVYDGMTVVLTASTPVVPCQTYHLKIAIADVGDRIYDSGVFLQAYSFTSAAPTISAQAQLNYAGFTSAYEGCVGGTYTVSISAAQAGPDTVYLQTSGTATNGVDYATIPSFVVIPAGQTSVTIPLTPYQDNVTEPSETATVSVINPCTLLPMASATLSIQDDIPPTISVGDSTLCFGQSTTLQVTGGVTYNWSPSAGLSSSTASNPTATPASTTTYTASIYWGGCVKTLSQTIYVSHPAVAIASSADTTCTGGSIIYTASASGGVNPYAYLWSNGKPTAKDTVTSAATYTVTATDAYGCTANASKTPVFLSPAIASSITGPTCIAPNSGAITLSMNGGTAPYTYHWNDGTNSQNRSNLSVGTYVVTATDSHGCSASMSDSVGQVTSVAQCNAGVPHFDVDMTGHPDSTWISTSVQRNSTCCGATAPDVCVSFDITLDPNAVGILFDIYSGARPSGSLYYQIDCGPATPVGTPICMPAGCTHHLTFCKPGGNTNQYILTSMHPVSISASATSANCYSGNSGSITLNIIGGSPPFTFHWSDGATVQNRTNLAAGTYTVTVNDTTLCAGSSTTASVIVNQPPLLAPVATPTNVLCNGASTGSINLAVTGGTAPYTYNWGGGVLTQNRTNLPAGSYAVVVTDAHSCTANTAATITQPTPISIANTHNNVSCSGGNNGTINLAVTGGNAPYTYNWGGAVTTQNRTNLTAGAYTVTVLDANNCSATSTITLSQPGGVSLSVAHTDASCFGGNNGSITVTVSGGTTPYTYNWGGGITSQNRTALTAGTYNVTVLDANLCSASAAITVSQPTLLALSSTHTDVACYGGSDGTINITVTGGVSPYTYNWGGAITTQNRTNLPVGNYSVIATDANACTISGNVNIAQPTALTASVTHTDVSCNGGNNGTINVTPSGGSTPYTYNWGGGITMQNRTGLAAGTYTVTITDSHACSMTASAVIAQPAVLSASNTHTNASCFAGANGTITLSVSGGTTPYNYNWGGGINTQNRTGLAAGTYTVIVTDAHACSTTSSATITQPSAIALSTTHSDVLCNGGLTGTINLSASGGTPAYSYDWGLGIITQNRTGLGIGTYTVTITDANSCTATISTTINQPLVLSAGETHADVSCNGGSNGTINITSAGGTAPYTYNWVGGATTQNRTGLAIGTYTVTVTDAHACSASISATLNEPTALVATTTHTDVSCYGGTDASVTLSVSGGVSPYTYNWGAGVTTQNRANLVAGSYTVTITDAHACILTNTTVIAQPASLAVSATHIDVTCFGQATGSINVIASAGSPAYTFNWNDGATTQNRTNLNSGTYTVTVTDAHACPGTATVVITQPTALAFTTAHTDVSCFAGNNGTITVSPTGGTAPYSYDWGGGVITQNRNNIVSGTYNVTVSDANLCSVSGSVTIAQPAAAVSATTASTTVNCFGGNNAGITLTPAGGTAPYTFNWSDGAITQNRANVSAGTYTVTVYDSHACSGTASAVVTQPAAALSAGTTTTDANCFAGNDGTITLTASGGTAPYSYTWNDGVTTQNRSSLTAGTYAVTVRDINACSTTSSVDIAQPTPITASAVSTPVGCYGGNNGTIIVTTGGGIAPYTFNWNDGATTQNRSNLTAGNYTVTVLDAHSCTVTTSSVVAQPVAALNITTSATDAACFGGSDGTASSLVTGGTLPYSYDWGSGLLTQNISNLSAGNYSITVTDSNFCSITASAVVGQPTAVAVTSTTTDVSCYGGNNGTASLTAGGGTPGYTYLWDNAATTANINNLVAGQYLFTVTDNHACTANGQVTIGQPVEALSVAAVASNVTCPGGSNGSITLDVVGGTGAYTYDWGGGISNVNVGSLPPGTYDLTVTDANMCSASTSVVISQPASFVVSTSKTNVLCFGGNSGTITTTVYGGVAPYSYLWNDAATTANRINLSIGTYAITISDSNACSITASVSIGQPASALNTTYTTGAVSCYGGSNGTINLTSTGGTTPYHYLWSDSSQSQNRTNLTAGSYTFTVTDNNLCPISQTVVVNQPIAALQVSLVVTNVACYNTNTGAITVTTSGGTPGYTYHWTSSVLQNRTNLYAGNYLLTVTDSKGCSVTTFGNVTQPAVLSATKTHTAISCYGGSNGAINVTANGGTAPYNFVWNDGATTQNRTNLTSATYRVTVSDANSCSLVLSDSVPQPLGPVNATSVITNVSCFGGATGSIINTVSGGSSPYTYLWNNGAITKNRSNLTAGNYTLTITDAHACPAIINVTISQPSAALSVALLPSNVSCYSGNNGTITTNSAGGTNPYTFQWNDGPVTQNRSNLTTGNYGVVVSDSNHCTAQASIAITQPSRALSATATATQVACNGGNDGTITLTVNGGTTAYSFLWNDGDTLQNKASAIAGNYSVTVSDAHACSTTTSISVAQPNQALNVAAVTGNVSCFSGSDGVINLAVNGGSIPYIYTWNDGNTGRNRTGLIAGNYSVTVTDSHACSATAAAVITQPAASLTASSIGYGVYCFGGTNATIDVTVLGGTLPYTYSWNDGAITEDRNNMAAGSYTVTVTDRNLCSVTVNTVLTQPAAALSATPAVNNVSCYSGNNGAINLAVAGGTAPYVYNWNDGITAQDRSNLLPGNFSVTVTDINACSTVANAVITQPSAPLAVAAFPVINVSCFGGSDGSIALLVTGGTTPYTFMWDDSSTIQNKINLIAGTYTATVTDANSCVASVTSTVGEPAAALVAVPTVNNVSCFGGNNASITLQVSGGTGPYTFNWADGPATQDRSNLSIGTYDITVTDAHSCQYNSSSTISQPPLLTNSISHTNVSCNGGTNGTIAVAVNGGVTPYSYTWTNGSTNAAENSLTAGSYTVTVTDANSCSLTATDVITEPTAIILSATHTDVSCFGGNNASINVTVTGGVTPYTYDWGGGTTTQNLNNLVAGTYNITVLDANACSVASAVAIAQPSAALNVTHSVANVKCYGGNNGSVNLHVSGGTGPYAYSWDNGTATQNLSGLVAGSYIVTVTDAQSCSSIDTAIVTQPSAALAAAPMATNINCYGDSTGSVNLVVTGGTTPYLHFSWSDNVHTQNRNKLTAGTYTVTVIDVNVCSASATAVISQPAAPLTATPSSSGIGCYGMPTGAVTLNVTGGTAPYTYSWNNGSSTQNIDSVFSGIYSVVVLDNNMCSTSASTTVGQPSAALNANTAVTNVGCYAGNTGAIQLSITGGTPPYAFKWDGGDTTQNLSNLVEGGYGVTVTDANSCNVARASVVSQPSAALNIAESFANVSCFGQSSGAITLDVTGGTAPYSYLWAGGSTSPARAGLFAGTYNVTVTDYNACSSTTAILITEPSALIVSPSSANASCFGSNNGSITLAVSGGTPAYLFNWSNGDTIQNLSSLSARSYQVTVADANACNVIKTVNITQPMPMAIQVTQVNVACFGGNNGAINLGVGAGTAPYTFDWGNGNFSQNRASLVAGVYTVTITDANSCSAQNTVTITEPAALVLTDSITNVACNGTSTGAISLNITGGTPSYTYTWAGGASTANRTNLTAGTYLVTVTDNHNCSVGTSATITQPATLVMSTTHTDVSCFGGNNGTINVTVSGGNGSYGYLWNDIVTTQNRANLVAGNYQVMAVDANSCSVTASIAIIQPPVLTGSLTHTDVSCFGNANGTVTSTVSGGTPVYNYSWSNGSSSQNLGAAMAGNYTLTITDANLCSVTASAIVTQPDTLTTTLAHTDVSCNGGNNGSITLVVNGGTAGYAYNWSNGPTSQNQSGIIAGNYNVTVSDAHACSATATATITEPAALTASISHADVSCNAGNNGAVNLSVLGGTPAYTYNWSNGGSSQNLSNVVAGSYSVTITDAHACSVTAGSAVSQPAALTLNAYHNDASCYGSGNGQISLVVSGGTQGYTYNWNDGVNTQNRINLGAGNYTVTVTDANSCSGTVAALIIQPPVLTGIIAHADVSCFGGSNGSATLTTSGGTPGYTYNWGNGATTQNRTNLTAGSYTVTIYDSHGCTTTNNVIVTQPNQLMALAAPVNVGCYGASTGAVNVTASGGTPSYSFNWGNNITVQNRVNVAAGHYTVTVTDTKGCSITTSANVTQPLSGVTANPSVTNVSCYGGTNGAITMNPSGGTSPYTYDWGSGITSQNRTAIPGGVYHVVITDANGCTINEAVTVNTPARILLTEHHVDPSCHSLNNGTVNVEVSGGVPTYRFNWSNGATTQNITNVSAGIYGVTVNDSHGCPANLDNIEVVSPVPLDVTATPGIPSVCYGTSGGSINTEIMGGTPPYTYHWNDNSNQQNISNLVAGDYKITVTDANGCQQSAIAFISSWPPLSGTALADQLPCKEAKGGIALNVSNGTLPYVYSWSNGATTQNLSGVQPGNYSVTVQDANGCKFDTTLDIENLNSFSVSAWGGGTVNLGETVELHALATGSSMTTYSWTPTQTISCPTCANTVAQPVNATVYTVVAVDTNGCFASDTVSADVKDDYQAFTPNAFTPNNDGNNDYFQFFGSVAGIKIFNVMIFDRWGEKVFESDSPDFRWDGTYKGVLENPGVFVYVMKITFIDGHADKIHKGSITLIR